MPIICEHAAPKGKAPETKRRLIRRGVALAPTGGRGPLAPALSRRRPPFRLRRVGASRAAI